MQVQKLRFYKTIFDIDYIDILQEIKEMLLDKWYVMGYFDEYYIPFKKTYLNKHYRHSSFIYGFDDVKKVLYAIAYTSNRKYEPFIFTYEQLRKSINVNFDRNKENYIEKGIDKIDFDIIKINDNYNFHININEIYTKIYDFLHSIDSTNIDKTEFIYGIECEKKFIEYIKIFLNNLDERYSRYFMDFKNLMLMRLKYLEDNGYIKNGYAEKYNDIALKQKLIHCLFIKYNITHDKNIIERLISIEECIIKHEIDILRDVLFDLKLYLTKCNEKEYR